MIICGCSLKQTYNIIIYAAAERAPTDTHRARLSHMSRRLLFLALSSSSTASRVMADEPQFRRVQTQFIAAAIDPVHGEGMKASSGRGTSDWGIWRVDPGPRGVQLREYDRIESTGGVAPKGWKFDKVQALRVEPHRTPCREKQSQTPCGLNAAARERADPRLTLAALCRAVGLVAGRARVDHGEA